MDGAGMCPGWAASSLKGVDASLLGFFGKAGGMLGSQLQEGSMQGWVHARIPKILTYLSIFSKLIRHSKMHGITVAGCSTTPTRGSRAGSS